MSKEKSDRVFAIIERALVPLILGLLVFTNQQAQVRISRAQTKLAEEQAKMAAVQSEQGFNIECIKLFFNDICGSDTTRQKMAIRLLKLLNDSLAKPLCEAASEITSQPQIAAAAASIRDGIVARELGGYRIEIVYPEGNEGCAREAAAIRDGLINKVAAETLIVRKVPAQAPGRYDFSGGYAIRYQAGSRSDAAQHLQSVLAASMPDKEFRLEPYGGAKMLRSITIIVPAKTAPATATDAAVQPGTR
jgi:hypothetical protein